MATTRAMEPSPALLPAPARAEDPIGVYIHVPFCAHICPYCDFTTYSGQEHLIPRYVAAVESDIRQREMDLKGLTAETVFLGGGTPSLLEPEQVDSILRAVRDTVTLTADAEITMEANPTSAEAGRFAAYREAGVNRLSIGAQTFDRRGLRALGRLHEAEDTTAAITAARAAGFTNVSLDLIFGWPGQRPDHLARDLEMVLNPASTAWEPEHLSLYSLIVEPGTPMADGVARGIVQVPDDDATADLYDLAMRTLGEAGWLHYEVANWARTADRQSRHNRIYWRNGGYLGIGAGAFGRIGAHRTMGHPSPRTYCTAIEQATAPTASTETITEELSRGETMMLGLRLLEDGVSRAAFAERHGVSLDAWFAEPLRHVVASGWVIDHGDRLTLTPGGLMVANDVCAAFL